MNNNQGPSIAKNSNSLNSITKKISMNNNTHEINSESLSTMTNSSPPTTKSRYVIDSSHNSEVREIRKEFIICDSKMFHKI